LEYDSVKIIITKEVEQQITHNIFYTAITRAKNMCYVVGEEEAFTTACKRIETTKRETVIQDLLS